MLRATICPKSGKSLSEKLDYPLKDFIVVDVPIPLYSLQCTFGFSNNVEQIDQLELLCAVEI